MSSINVKGIEWEMSRHNGKTVYTHHNIVISWDESLGTWTTRDTDSNLIIARELPSDCIKDTTVMIWEAYASRFIPSWEAA